MLRLPWVEKALGRHDGATGEKVMTISRAVRELIRPGFALQVGSGLGYPMALLYEIIRQFWGAVIRALPLLHTAAAAPIWSPSLPAGW